MTIAALLAATLLAAPASGATPAERRRRHRLQRIRDRGHGRRVPGHVGGNRPRLGSARPVPAADADRRPAELVLAAGGTAAGKPAGGADDERLRRAAQHLPLGATT